MNDINSFLGFTDTIKEPRKTKVEDTLSKSIRDNKGNIYNRRTFLLIKILDGRNPLKVENIITYNKRTCEPNKPKTEYRLINNEGSFFDMNKTEYDFCVYCIEKGYTTIEAINKYISEEENRLQVIAERKAEDERIQEEKERVEAEEVERINRMIKEEVLTLPVEEKELMNNIFLSMLGMEADNRSYTLIALIHNFDNVICKNDIISRLHNDNKASIKTFECITGLKLPKAYKARIDYLKSITSRDFIGMVEYKERKKAEYKNIITEEFYIIENGERGSMKWTKVIGEPYTKNNIKMFFRCTNGRYNLSEENSGAAIVYGKNKTECKQKFDDLISNMGKDKVLAEIERIIKLTEEKIGKNPRYQLTEQIA